MRVILGVALLLSFLQVDLFIASAQRATQRRTPPKQTAAKPSATPVPKTEIEKMGAPPAVPTLKKPPEQEVNPGDVVKVETTEVMFPVTVRDAEGHLINDLTRNDFRIYEDNRLQPLSDLALRQVPVDVVLMVDASSSVAKNLDDFRRATLYKDGREEQVALKAQDKGQQEQVRAVCASVLQGGAAPISLDDLAATSRATFRVLDSLRERQPFFV